jgi:hypothetical protein
MNKILTWGAVILGILFTVFAVVYWTTQAGSLPAYLPGYMAGSTIIHFKHGLASLIVGLGLFAFAWFTSGPKKSSV